MNINDLIYQMGNSDDHNRAIASLQACEIVPKIKCGPIREKENSVPDLATEQRLSVLPGFNDKESSVLLFEKSARFLNRS